MAYQCIISTRECDGCGLCRSTAAHLRCGLCGNVINDGELYYNIDETAVCDICIRQRSRIA